MSTNLSTIIMLIMVIPSKLMCTLFWYCLIVSTFSAINAASASLGSNGGGGKSIDQLTGDISIGGGLSENGETEPGGGNVNSAGGGLISYSVRCPPSHLIKPCDCVEIEKGLESEFNENESLALTNETNESSSSSSSNHQGVTGDEINVNSEPHPDIIETVVFCKHIYSRKQLMESMKAFKRHRINYLVIDSCSIPPFPTNIFNQINILWMEVLNSTIQFRENFFECGAACL
ncbi:uncharacterized protein LOC128395044 [Panonychus citri]|uniref:uncharacterized protein LOC128395044 n=1 Tax=Panonychus citri TaxID=50023 RepID=UPI002307D9FA|nr:uncharacterized protein LOC128395044 [Panonychus citri]